MFFSLEKFQSRTETQHLRLQCKFPPQDTRPKISLWCACFSLYRFDKCSRTHMGNAKSIKSPPLVESSASCIFCFSSVPGCLCSRGMIDRMVLEEVLLTVDSEHIKLSVTQTHGCRVAPLLLRTGKWRSVPAPCLLFCPFRC